MAPTTAELLERARSFLEFMMPARSAEDAQESGTSALERDLVSILWRNRGETDGEGAVETLDRIIAERDEARDVLRAALDWSRREDKWRENVRPHWERSADEALRNPALCGRTGCEAPHARADGRQPVTAPGITYVTKGGIGGTGQTDAEPSIEDCASLTPTDPEGCAAPPCSPESGLCWNHTPPHTPPPVERFFSQP